MNVRVAAAESKLKRTMYQSEFSNPDFGQSIRAGDRDERAERFLGNQSHKDHFKLLQKDHNWLLVGARNIVYNVSLHDLTEAVEHRIDWPVGKATKELCTVKGKLEDDCQNYIRVLVKINDEKLLVCGTNAYSPKCKDYRLQDGYFTMGNESEGKALCPFSPDHNSTSVYVDGQLYTATVADFSGTDPMIYRAPLRTERSDLKQLNTPNFVSSFAYKDYVFFFFREIAVEYINCGKAMFSRVARVCKHDKGGPHQFGDRWTSFLKSRLNCSVPGDYPFYFDEIQSTSDVIEGEYGGAANQLVYGVFTTPSNSISGSAVCAFSMQDVMQSFEGQFKEQETMNANWLAVQTQKVPEPRPGGCVNDSRTLPDLTVNFVKNHALMDKPVPSFFGQPVVIRVSMQYRFTQIAVDAQVETADGKKYDVLFLGTDNGKVIKTLNAASFDSDSNVSPVVVEEIQVHPPQSNIAIKNMQVVRMRGGVDKSKLVIVSDDEVTAIKLHRCGSDKVRSCRECVALQDPYCAWSVLQERCVAGGTAQAWASIGGRLLQNISSGEHSGCGAEATPPVAVQTEKNSPNGPKLHASQERPQIYSADTLAVAVVVAIVVALAIGFTAGFAISRRCCGSDGEYVSTYRDRPFHEHLNSFPGHDGALNDSAYLPPCSNNKPINLVLNVPPKNANGKNANSSAENKPVQKVKKTYIYTVTVHCTNTKAANAKVDIRSGEVPRTVKYSVSLLVLPGLFSGKMATNNCEKNDTTSESESKTWWGYASGVSGAMYAPVKYVLLRGRDLSKSTVFGVKERVNGWVFRIDNPHKGTNFNHMNVRHRFTQRPDPHTRLPPGTTVLGKAVTSFTDIAGPVLFTAAVVHDTAKIGQAAYNDLKEHQTLGSETAKSTASVAAVWTGGFAGGYIGSKLGYFAGGLIGSCLWGVGFVPGSALGAVVGTYLGGAAVAGKALEAAENAVDHYKVAENQPSWNGVYSAVSQNSAFLWNNTRQYAAALFPGQSQSAVNAADNSKVAEKWTYRNALSANSIYLWNTCRQGTPSSSGAGSALAAGLASAKYIPSRYQLLAGKFLSKSTTFGIRDVTAGRKGWIFRVDNPHIGQEVNHLNINPKFRGGVKDPHIALPPGTAAVGNAATKVIRVAGAAAMVAAVAVDSYRIGKAVKNDLDEKNAIGFKTAKTSASVASGWSGGIAGAVVGNSFGATVGGAIGALFGGAGAVPGAAIGSLVGGLLLGVTGGVTGSLAAEAVAESIRGDVRGVIREAGKRLIIIEQSFTPETKEHEEQWLKVLQDTVFLILNERKMCVATFQPLDEVFSQEILDSLEPHNSVGLTIAEGTMSRTITNEACNAPQFFFSAMAFTSCDMQPAELEELIGCSETDIPASIANEYIFMNSFGTKLLWLNPRSGTAEAVLFLNKYLSKCLKLPANY
ncbi:Hypothetical predicted protein [Cloeon dipterum]|uniref:Semaphorin-1A n=1 Tax=Cloeon dipterum TaxID=197152 RepID=A0A8S1BQM1_9INSE|nr:Hypothetical predicted protein [Cloeon dipterum]